MSEMQKSLYEQVGGQKAVEAAVIKMYDKVLADPLLSPYFKETNMNDLRRSQIGFVTMALGGPHHYKSIDLRAAHLELCVNGLTHKHFDATVGHLQEALRELGVAELLIREATAILETTRRDVLNL